MKKVLDFIKSKSVGYFIVLADALLALITAIIFFATYEDAMATNATANVPETIGIFLIAGCIIEIVVLIIPQYRFIHIVAIAMFALSLYKEIFLIPNLIADRINNVQYQGGNLDTNIFYLVMLFIIIISAIVAAFLGFYKKSAKLALLYYDGLLKNVRQLGAHFCFRLQPDNSCQLGTNF